MIPVLKVVLRAHKHILKLHQRFMPLGVNNTFWSIKMILAKINKTCRSLARKSKPAEWIFMKYSQSQFSPIRPYGFWKGSPEHLYLKIKNHFCS